MIKKKQLDEIVVLGLLIYILFKVILDMYTFGVLKLLMTATIVVGFLLFYNNKKLYNSDIYLTFAFAIFACYILWRCSKLEMVFFRRAIYEYILYMMILFMGAYFSRVTDLKIIYNKVGFWGILLVVSSFWQLLSGSGEIRTLGLSRSIQAQGMLLAIYAQILFYLYWEEKNRKYLFLLVLCMIAIISTGARGPLIASFASLVFMYFYRLYQEQKGRGILKISIVILCIAILVIWFFSVEIHTGNETLDFWIGRLQNSFSSENDVGNHVRTVRWEYWIQIFRQNFYWGIGPSMTGSWNVDVTLGVTESGLLRHCVELGVIGSILYYIPIVHCLKYAVKKLKLSDNSRKLQVMHIAIIIAILIEDAVMQITEEITVAFFLWYSLGVIYGTAQNVRKSEV